MGQNNDAPQPQANSAYKVTDPSSVDDTATFTFSDATKITATDYQTFIQDQTNFTQPAAFNGNSKYAPSSSPFVLSIIGSGFNATGLTTNPLVVYLQLGNNIALVPQLQDSANFRTGHLFGYKIISDTKLFVYTNGLLTSKVWLADITDSTKFTGAASANLKTLETGNEQYAYLNSIPQMQAYVAAAGSIAEQANYLSKISAKISVTITQSPYIVGAIGYRDLNSDSLFPTQDTTSSYLKVYGHGLKGLQVLFVLDTSILSQNVSVLPKNILQADHTKTTIQNATVQQISQLKYFKDGPNSAFLGELSNITAESIADYKYFDSDGNVQSNGFVSSESLPGEKFTIISLPSGVYTIVLYDPNTGIYAKAAEQCTINSALSSTAMQVHDTSPTKIALKAPTIIVNGFNLPVQTDITGDDVMYIALVRAEEVGLSTPLTEKAIYNGVNSKNNREGVLVLNANSGGNDISGKGSVSFSSNTQLTVKFSQLDIPDDIASGYSTMVLVIELTSGVATRSGFSPPLSITIPPTILFLTNTKEDFIQDTAVLTQNSISVDGQSGQLILHGTPANSLFIVGNNLGNGKNASVKAGNDTLKILSFTSIEQTTFGKNSILEVEFPGSENNKGVVPIAVTVDHNTSEPRTFALPLNLLATEVIDNGNNSFSTKDTITRATNGLFNVIPYNTDTQQFNNAKNIMMSSTLDASVVNIGSGFTNISVGSNKINVPFVPTQIIIPSNTKLTSLNSTITFSVFDIFSISYSKPTIIKLVHENNKSTDGAFKHGEIMMVIGTGFVNGMRYKIGSGNWTPVNGLSPIGSLADLYNVPSDSQFFEATLPTDGFGAVKIQISSQDAKKVSNVQASGSYGQGAPNAQSITINAKYSDMLKPNQKLPFGLKQNAKGSQITLTDYIDSIMSIYGQLAPFLNSYRIILVPIRIIVCIIDVICALINPFQLIVAIIALMDCIIDLLSLFPQLAIPIMILSFLQNFLPFVQTLIVQIQAYVVSLMNSLLAQVRAQINQETAVIAAAEQQAFSELRQVFDAIAFLEPPLSILLIFKQLLQVAMKFPCAANLGGGSGSDNCPPDTIKNLIGQSNDQTETKPPIPTVNSTSFFRVSNVVKVITDNQFPVQVGDTVNVSPGDDALGFAAGNKTIATIVNLNTFTYAETGNDAVSQVVQTISDPNVNDPKRQALAQAYCQAIDLQIATASTIPGISNLGSTATVPTLNLTLPDISTAIECLTNRATAIQNSLNAGIVPITTIADANAEVAAFIACLETLANQTQQSLDDVCPFAVSGINSELKVTPRRGLTRPDGTFVKIKGPTTDNSNAGSNLVDLVPFTQATSIADSTVANVNFTSTLGVPQDFESPIIVTTENKSGVIYAKDSISFNVEDDTIPSLINAGDIVQFIGGDYNGLQFPILSVSSNFTNVKITTTLNITPEQQTILKCGVVSMQIGYSGFDIRIISSLGIGNIAVVDADNKSTAEIAIYPYDHHGHLLGPGFANKIALNVISGSGTFEMVPPSSTTDDLGIIQESGDHYIARIKSDCPGIVILSASVCNVVFVDIGYDTTDPSHKITTRIKTIQVLFKPSISLASSTGTLSDVRTPQVPGTHFNN